MEKFLVEISARHVHLCQKTVDALFGEGHQLTPIKDLSQPGQFACEEKVTVIGPRGKLSCRILGPTRKEDQIEVSLTEARQLGIEALIRDTFVDALPLQPLCRPDCKGLCPQCGVDLNEHPEHEHKVADINDDGYATVRFNM